jgi:hypothetical protein
MSFGFVHDSRTLFCRDVPNPSITIRNFFIAVGGWVTFLGRHVTRGGQRAPEEHERVGRHRRAVAHVHARGLDALVVDEVAALELGLLGVDGRRVDRHVHLARPHAPPPPPPQREWRGARDGVGAGVEGSS